MLKLIWAMPYAGALDRLIISFNVTVNAVDGSDKLHEYGAR
ncbi:MAG: hypothetical protein ACRBC3_08425 [Burkholderiaceae bacterium]